MKIRVWAVLLTGLALLSLHAQEIDKAAQCDAAYAACLTQCDTSKNLSGACYESCDKTYEACLQGAQQLPGS